MIAYISGTVADVGLDYLVVDNQGIGYQIFYPRPETIKQNETIVIHTYQHVREDAIVLFGFENKQELSVFMQLISVKGVGPKTGLAILSKSSSDELIRAVDQEDIAYLKKLPGIGAKTASQILLDLRGKFVADTSQKASKVSPVVDEALQALIDLGFKRNEVNSIKNELSLDSNSELSELIRKGLQLLNSRKRG
ncbi:Holliday junction branch migration protein RuvA [Erysipelothrix sp. HDW6A]|uniref:Holliday junction branch migration protein RuvA n=1 Tax=Erysipelothrix sp. HDW6A TaxID=2714928 RepID=UPI00140B92A9|nr:Holliday junction branch migration protein RuvA [Erysipelothrix sp. HDW6A]QIK57485.1 Holliday junction branch migration protein RuvA [Erysipelothrix sp. HDW6A]